MEHGLKEKEGLKMSITEGGRDRTNKAITSLEERFQDCSKVGVVLATSVEMLGVDLRTKTQAVGSEEEARRKKCDVRFSLVKKKSVLRIGVRKLLRTGLRERLQKG